MTAMTAPASPTPAASATATMVAALACADGDSPTFPPGPDPAALTQGLLAVAAAASRVRVAAGPVIAPPRITTMSSTPAMTRAPVAATALAIRRPGGLVAV